MRQRRFHAAIASVGLHLLFVIVAAFLFSGQRELNQDTFEGAFVTLTPTRTDAPTRPTRRNVTVSTPHVKTAATVHTPKQMSNLTQLSTEKTAVVRQIPEMTVDTCSESCRDGGVAYAAGCGKTDGFVGTSGWCLCGGCASN